MRIMDKYEERFFKCFGIEPKEEQYGKYVFEEPLKKPKPVSVNVFYYPRITDTILLDLICILNSKTNKFDTEYHKVKDRSKLKFVILKDCVYNKELIQKEVQKLFKEN